MFFANPPAVERLRLNHFLKVEAPAGRTLLDLEHRLEQFNILMEGSHDIVEQAPEESEDIHFIANVLHGDPETNLIERGVSALLAYHNRTAETEQREIEEETSDELAADFTGEANHIHIFNKAVLSDDVKSLLTGPGELEKFSQPLIVKAYIKDKIELLERVLGRSGSQAKNVTSEIIKDMLVATDYPPYIEGVFWMPCIFVDGRVN